MPLAPVLHLLVEFGPIAVFLAAYETSGDFYAATAAFVIATVAAVTVTALLERRIPIFPFVSALPVIAFGAPSIILHDADLFIVRETIADLVFAAVLLWSVGAGRPILKTFFHATFAISDNGWRRLTIRWSIFYFVLAFFNEIVRGAFAEDVWVYYKMATILATLAFACYQLTLTARERIAGESNCLGLRTRPLTTAQPTSLPIALRARVEE